MTSFIFIMLLTANNLPIIHLNSTNHVKIDSPINHESINLALYQLNNIVEKNFYVYLDTPGGVVDEGDRFVSQLQYKQATGSYVTCIAENALSMGFYIFQNCKCLIL